MTQPAHADTEKATPRPWRTNPDHRNGIEDANGEPVILHGFLGSIASAQDSEAEQNRRDVLTAVNAYDAMREALEAARGWVPHVTGDVPHFADNCVTGCLRAKVNNALAAAEGKETTR